MAFTLKEFGFLMLQIGMLLTVEVSPAHILEKRRWPPKKVTIEEGKPLQLTCGPANVAIWFVNEKDKSNIVAECFCDKCENYEREKYVVTSARPQDYSLSHYQMQVLSVELNVTKIDCLNLSPLDADFFTDTWIVSLVSNMIAFSANNQSHELALVPGSDVHVECLTLRQKGQKLVLYRNQLTNVLQVTDSSKTINFLMTNLKCGTQFVVGCLIEGDKEREKIISVSVSPCEANYLNFTANNETKDLDVEIGSDVVFTCTSAYQPGSYMTIYEDKKDNILRTAKFPEQLMYVMPNVSCGVSISVSCMIDDSKAERSIKIAVKPCKDKYVTFTADSKMINHTEVYSDSPVLLECTSDLGRFSKFILYNNTPSNVIHQTKDSLMYALKGLTPGTFFTVGCQVESSKLTVYSELFITVKPNEPDVSNSSVGILIAVTVAPCLFILGLAVYCISKYRLKKKFKKVPKQDNHRFIYSSHINDKIFQPPIFGDKSSHLKLILNLDKSPNSQPPPSYSEIMNKL